MEQLIQKILILVLKSGDLDFKMKNIIKLLLQIIEFKTENENGVQNGGEKFG